jgi:hypothetical protein
MWRTVVKTDRSVRLPRLSGRGLATGLSLEGGCGGVDPGQGGLGAGDGSSEYEAWEQPRAATGFGEHRLVVVKPLSKDAAVTVELSLRDPARRHVAEEQLEDKDAGPVGGIFVHVGDPSSQRLPPGLGSAAPMTRSFRTAPVARSPRRTTAAACCSSCRATLMPSPCCPAPAAGGSSLPSSGSSPGGSKPSRSNPVRSPLASAKGAAGRECSRTAADGDTPR